MSVVWGLFRIAAYGLTLIAQKRPWGYSIAPSCHMQGISSSGVHHQALRLGDSKHTFHDEKLTHIIWPPAASRWGLHLFEHSTFLFFCRSATLRCWCRSAPFFYRSPSDYQQRVALALYLCSRQTSRLFNYNMCAVWVG